MKTDKTLNAIAETIGQSKDFDGVIVIGIKGEHSAFGFAGMHPLTILAFQQSLATALQPKRDGDNIIRLQPSRPR